MFDNIHGIPTFNLQLSALFSFLAIHYNSARNLMDYVITPAKNITYIY